MIIFQLYRERIVLKTHTESQLSDKNRSLFTRKSSGLPFEIGFILAILKFRLHSGGMFAAISEKGYGKLHIIYLLVYDKCKN